MGRLILRADMAMLHVGQHQYNNSGNPQSPVEEKCFIYCAVSLHWYVKKTDRGCPRLSRGHTGGAPV